MSYTLTVTIDSFPTIGLYTDLHTRHNSARLGCTSGFKLRCARTAVEIAAIARTRAGRAECLRDFCSGVTRGEDALAR